MINIQPPNYLYCPFCARELGIRKEEGKNRKFCSFCGWTYYPHVATAVGAVIEKDKLILMVKRNREPFKNTWMFPAGFVDFGEKPFEALRREIREEVGAPNLIIRKLKYLAIYQAEDDPRSPGHFVIFYRVLDWQGDFFQII